MWGQRARALRYIQPQNAESEVGLLGGFPSLSVAWKASKGPEREPAGAEGGDYDRLWQVT